jgi:3D (Asp-Asp-Asp) domain-containing protein
VIIIQNYKKQTIVWTIFAAIICAVFIYIGISLKNNENNSKSNSFDIDNGLTYAGLSSNTTELSQQTGIINNSINTQTPLPLTSDKPATIITIAPTIESTQEPTIAPTTEPTIAPTPKPIYITVVATAYCPCYECCDKWALNRPKDENGNDIVYTASGAIAKPNHTIATDPSVIPWGTKLKIGDVIYTAEDMGGSIKGNKIDIFFTSHAETEAFGIRTLTAEIIK